MLAQQLSRRYNHYTDQQQQYLTLYEKMIDPDRSTRDTLGLAQTMNRRYDVIPFAGHELLRDVQVVTQKLLSYLADIIRDPSTIATYTRELAQYRAVTDW